jgi:CxxC motif-containing protein (DUF1111 family)
MKPMTSLMTSVLTSLAVMASATVAATNPPPPPAAKRPKIRPPASVIKPALGTTPRFGDPLPGADASSITAFNAGRDEFMSIETPEGGLGPIFNDHSCAACHFAAAPGGASNHQVTRFGRLSDGKFDALASLGGSLLQARAIDPSLLERIPKEANVVARRVTTPLFGAGLIEAIPDETILLNAQRSKPDGVTGHASMITDVVSGKMRVGRFGWKAQQATLLAFSGDAYLNEMGVTNRFFPTENAPNGNTALLARFIRSSDIEDKVDPATGKSDIDRAADFMRLLAPPQPLRQTANAIAGSKLFDQIKCTACHVPVMYTGTQSFEPLSQKAAALYSDLLLHDMGKLGDGIEQANAKGREMRTAPLWGLRARPTYLHDGRTTSVQQAIVAHDGEAAPSRNRFTTLKPAEQQQLLEFLNSI